MSTSEAPRLTSHEWGVLFVLCGAIFLEGIDISMMGVALPSIRAELGLPTADLQWVVTAYALGYGGFVLLGGRAADLLGRRRMFVTWLVVFLAFSGLGGLATEGWMLILARFATGVAAGFLTPAGLSTITTMFAEGPRRDRALLVYAGTAAGGFSLGMVIGGLLTALHWRWVFFAPVVVAAVLLVVAIRMLPRQDPAPGSRFDIAGSVTLTVAMLVLVLAIVQAPDVEPGLTASMLVVALVLLAGFTVIERRSAAPLVRLGILRSAALARANLGALLLVGSFMGFQFVAVLYLQELRNWSTIETGLALAVAGIDAVLAPTLTPVLVRKLGNGRVVVAGLALAALAYALFLPLTADGSYWLMLPALLVLGVAFALAYGPLTIAATDGVDEHEQGLAGGILTTSFQFGAALGLAVVTAVVVTASGDGPLSYDALRAGLLVALAAAVLGVVVTAPGLRAHPRATT
jgi:MFS family permease